MLRSFNFSAFFTLLALLLSSAVASPAGNAANGRDNDVDIVVDALNYATPAHLAPTPTIDLDRLKDYTANATANVFAPAYNAYTINCAATAYPNVCENWCYYAYCHKRATSTNDPAWTVTVNRTANLRPQSECGRLNPNKCSTAGVGRPWPAAPSPSLDCDEQPKNTNNEGGANAATRCMPASENRGEGSRWSQHIRNGGPGMIPNGGSVQVVLQNPTGPICAPYSTPTAATFCPQPASPTDANVGSDAVRQQ